MDKKKYLREVSESISDIELSKDELRKKLLGNCYKPVPYKRELHLSLKYGLSIDDYYELLYKQEGKCLICGIHESQLKRSLSVDHNHLTGKVRGLICTNCNTGLGCFKDNTQLLGASIKYLEKT